MSDVTVTIPISEFDAMRDLIKDQAERLYELESIEGIPKIRDKVYLLRKEADDLEVSTQYWLIKKNWWENRMNMLSNDAKHLRDIIAFYKSRNIWQRVFNIQP